MISLYEKIKTNSRLKILNFIGDVNEVHCRSDFIQEHEVCVSARRRRAFLRSKFSFLRKDTSIIKRALAAARTLCKAHCSPKLDKVSMKRVRFPLRNKRPHCFERLIGGLRFDQTESVANSMNVRVDWKHLPPKRKEKNAGSGFKSDSMKRCES